MIGPKSIVWEKWIWIRWRSKSLKPVCLKGSLSPKIKAVPAALAAGNP